MVFLLFVYALECVVVDACYYYWLKEVLFPHKPSLDHPDKFVERIDCFRLSLDQSHELSG